MNLSEKLQNFVAWIKYKEFLIKKGYEIKIFPPLKKGEIFLCDFGTNVGIEIDKIRPAIVWQNPKIGNYRGIVVIPLTRTIKPQHTNDKRYVIIDETDTKKGNLKSKSRVLTDQIRTVSKLRLRGKQKAFLNEKVILKIEDALKFTLGI